MKLGYVLLYVADVAATATFYEKAFGVTRRFAPESGQYIEMETGDTALGFVAEAFVRDGGTEFAPLRPDVKPAGIEIAFVTGNVAEAVKRAADAGAKIVKPPAIMPWGQTVAYVRDLNGALVELCTKMG